jgi:hypothetical protein
MACVRILDAFGADTINIRSTCYTKMPDGAFYLTPEDADCSLADCKSGAYRAPGDYTSPVAVPIELVESLVRGLAPCDVKTALVAALDGMSLKLMPVRR